MIQYNTSFYDIIQYNTSSYDMIQYNTSFYDMIQYNTSFYDMIQYNKITFYASSYCLHEFSIIRTENDIISFQKDIPTLLNSI